MAYGSYSPAPYNPYYERPRPRFGTTPIELVHLSVAMVVLSGVLYYAFQANEAFQRIAELPVWAQLLAAFLIGSLGFVLHELGHKFTAQHFGHWSEFRASWSGLALAILIVWYLKVPIALPGATWHNAYSKRDQGRISAMGPLVNLAIAIMALFVALTTGKHSVTGQLASIVVTYSTFLGVFNLVPFGPLDGRKVIAWNPVVWAAMVALGVGLIWSGAGQFQF